MSVLAVNFSVQNGLRRQRVWSPLSHCSENEPLREQYNSIMKARLSEINALLLLNFIELAVFPSDAQFLVRKFPILKYLLRYTEFNGL